MRPARPPLAFLRSNTALVAVVISLAACDSAVEIPSREPPSTDRPKHAEPAFDSPASAPDLAGRLSFVSDYEGNSEIYTVGLDGSGLTRLTARNGRDESPAWSPDGSMIAFQRDDVIWVMTADGDEMAPQTKGTGPAWSPWGSLAFSTARDGNANIATFDYVRGGIKGVTNERGVSMQPTWSPDGQLLAFVGDQGAFDIAQDIYTIKFDGSNRRVLTQSTVSGSPLRLFLHPSWSPDGSRIAFVYGTVISGSNERDMVLRFNVAVMADDGSDARDLAWAGDIAWMDPLDPGSLAWSPDGAGIAYSSVETDARTVNYVSLDRSWNGTIIRNGHSPSWSR